jgi:hypothetical protein
MRYASCYWVEILGLDRHYQKAEVDAESTENAFSIKTTNVRALHLTLPEGPAQNVLVKIDDQALTTRPVVAPNGSYNVYLNRKDGKWSAVLPQRLQTDRNQRPQKIAGLQGPIDDAFTDAFLCVRGSGKAWHEATHKYAEGNLQRFQAEWAKYFRGQLPIKDDVDVSHEDILSKHLILFGDPSSNSLIANVLDGLPLQWTKDEVAFAGMKYSSAEHVPVMIYPSPVNSARYVVLNSGHTFHAADFQGTNALLYPRLGDYAVLKLAGTQRDPLAVEVATAGLFDDFWRIAGK